MAIIRFVTAVKNSALTTIKDAIGGPILISAFTITVP